MKINITYSSQIDLESIYFALLLIRLGFYKSKQFLLSQKLLNKIEVDNISVLIPPEVVKLGKNFIRELGGKDPEKYYSDCLEYRDKFVFDERVVKVILQNEERMRVQAKLFSEENLDLLKNAIKFLSDFFPIENHIETINIYLRSSGTICSYKRLRNKTCHIEPRLDAKITDVVFCLVCSFIHEFYESFMELNKGLITWEEKQRMAEFVVTKSKLKKIIGEYVSINQLLDRKIYLPDTSVINDSNHIYEIFGYPIVSEVKSKNGKVYANGVQMENLTEQEEDVLKLLVKDKGTIVSYDELADIIWRKDSYTKFSIQAIQKTVERLRKKLDYYGVTPTLITNKMGQGYIYNS